MQQVMLSDFAYPCVAYCIRRVGINIESDRLVSLHGEKYSPSTILERGDLVVWERKDGQEITYATLTINERGPITTKLYLGRHFGVYEGDGLVSDTTFDGDTYFPRIRLMPLSERLAPKEFLRLNTLKTLERR